jgi:hypothetical protein
MNIKYTFGIMAVIIAFIMGCSGTLGKFKTKSGEDRTATIQEIKDNLDDYDIYHCPLVTVLDPNNDDKAVEMTGKSCSSVDHQTASDFAKEYPMKDFPVKGLKEILGPDDQFYGYIIIWNNRLVSAGAKLAEDKTMRVYPHYVPYGGP